MADIVESKLNDVNLGSNNVNSSNSSSSSSGSNSKGCVNNTKLLTNICSSESTVIYSNNNINCSSSSNTSNSLSSNRQQPQHENSVCKTNSRTSYVTGQRYDAGGAPLQLHHVLPTLQVSFFYSFSSFFACKLQTIFLQQYL